MKRLVQVWNRCVNQEQMEFTVQRGEYPQSIPRNFITVIFQKEECRKLSLWLLLSEDIFSYFSFTSSVL